MAKKKTKAQKRKRFIVNDELYRKSYLVSAGESFTEAYNWALSKGVDFGLTPEQLEEDHRFDGCTVKNDDHGNILIWFKRLVPPGTLVAHECLHGTFMALNQVGVTDISVSQQEAIAYHQEFLVREIGHKLWS